MQSRPNILIVDDDPIVVVTFARMLRLSDYDVVTAGDAESGLREAREAHPDAALVDLRLPYLDGLEFLHRLRAQEVDRRMPVAIITGDYLLEDTVRCELRSLHATVHFKPLWLADLVDITERLLRGGAP